MQRLLSLLLAFEDKGYTYFGISSMDRGIASIRDAPPIFAEKSAIDIAEA